MHPPLTKSTDSWDPKRQRYARKGRLTKWQSPSPKSAFVRR